MSILDPLIYLLDRTLTFTSNIADEWLSTSKLRLYRVNSLKIFHCLTCLCSVTSLHWFLFQLLYNKCTNLCALIPSTAPVFFKFIFSPFCTTNAQLLKTLLSIKYNTLEWWPDLVLDNNQVALTLVPRPSCSPVESIRKVKLPPAADSHTYCSSSLCLLVTTTRSATR